MDTFARGLLLAGALHLLLASTASAVTIDWVPVGNPGNLCETQSQGCFGAVADAYRIAESEVSNSQYAEFLNAKAAADPLGLYNANMGAGFGGITRSGISGSYTYSAIGGREAMPVNYVSSYDALRFANWLHNGQGSGDTEDGAYTLLGGTADPINGLVVTRNAGASIFLTSEDEWYKSAYHNAVGLSATDYFDYPVGSDVITTCSAPPGGSNHANCEVAVGDLSAGGSYLGSLSPYGTFDQGGNVWEWNEDVSGLGRVARGGAFGLSATNLAASFRSLLVPTSETSNVGFRVGSPVPEPGTGLLLMAGLLGLAQRRRSQART